ncbi:MAG: low molecular weight protein-tyrosine-phosphatase [Bacteroidota bacterium]
MSTTKVLMVCLGNICRSPLAEGIFKSKVEDHKIQVDSAGTANYHVGESPDPRSIEIARANGIDISQQKGRQFTQKDFKDFDYIFAMDQSNYDNIIALAETESDKNKVDLILNQLTPDENLEVPDPYYGGKDGFKNVFQMLDKATNVLKEKLLS